MQGRGVIREMTGPAGHKQLEMTLETGTKGADRARHKRLFRLFSVVSCPFGNYDAVFLFSLPSPRPVSPSSWLGAKMPFVEKGRPAAVPPLPRPLQSHVLSQKALSSYPSPDLSRLLISPIPSALQNAPCVEIDSFRWPYLQSNVIMAEPVRLRPAITCTRLWGGGRSSCLLTN